MAMVIPFICPEVQCDLFEPTSHSFTHKTKLDMVLCSLTILTQLSYDKQKYALDFFISTLTSKWNTLVFLFILKHYEKCKILKWLLQ